MPSFSLTAAADVKGEDQPYLAIVEYLFQPATKQEKKGPVSRCISKQSPYCLIFAKNGVIPTEECFKIRNYRDRFYEIKNATKKISLPITIPEKIRFCA